MPGSGLCSRDQVPIPRPPRPFERMAGTHSILLIKHPGVGASIAAASATQSRDVRTERRKQLCCMAIKTLLSA